jgi:ABC-type lipoprotein export system ATPase subunit
MSGISFLALRGVSKVYRGRQVVALRNIDLTIGRGQFVAVVGPSGSGKSTLLHLLGALDRPTAGEIVFDGTRLQTLARPDRFRLHTVGFVFQMHYLLPALTAVENVEIPMIPMGGGRHLRRQRAHGLIDRVGLAHRANHLPSQLSGGESQRIAVARALANDPPLILADEPTGELDTVSGEAIIRLLGELHREGRTVVVVTHNPQVAHAASRIIELRDGSMVGDRMNRR